MINNKGLILNNLKSKTEKLLKCLNNHTEL